MLTPIDRDFRIGDVIHFTTGRYTGRRVEVREVRGEMVTLAYPDGSTDSLTTAFICRCGQFYTPDCYTFVLSLNVAPLSKGANFFPFVIVRRGNRFDDVLKKVVDEFDRPLILAAMGGESYLYRGYTEADYRQMLLDYGIEEENKTKQYERSANAKPAAVTV